MLSLSSSTIVGLTQFSKRNHLVRAMLEAVCYQTREVLEAMQQDSGVEITSMAADGGMSKSDFFVQLLANVLGIPIGVQLSKPLPSYFWGGR